MGTRELLQRIIEQAVRRNWVRTCSDAVMLWGWLPRETSSYLEADEAGAYSIDANGGGGGGGAGGTSAAGSWLRFPPVVNENSVKIRKVLQYKIIEVHWAENGGPRRWLMVDISASADA